MRGEEVVVEEDGKKCWQADLPLLRRLAHCDEGRGLTRTGERKERGRGLGWRTKKDWFNEVDGEVVFIFFVFSHHPKRNEMSPDERRWKCFREHLLHHAMCRRYHDFSRGLLFCGESSLQCGIGWTFFWRGDRLLGKSKSKSASSSFDSLLIRKIGPVRNLEHKETN